MALTATQQQDVIKYCVGLFNAAPGGYMGTLADMVQASGTTQMAMDLANSPAFKGLSFAYSDASTDEQFVTAFLNNLLGSTVSAANMTFAHDWALAAVASSGRAQMMITAIDAIAGQTATDADWGAAKTQMDTRMAAATTYTITNSGMSTDLNALQTVVNGGDVTTGQTFTLTTGIDTVVGTAGNDTINAADANTGGLDSVDGAAGTDTLNFLDLAGANALSDLAVTGVEIVNVRSAGAAVADTTGFTGVTALNVTQGTSVNADAATTTAVTVSGITAGGAVTVTGGSTQTVTAAGGVVALDGAAGAITLTDTDATNITVLDGTDVTVTSTSDVTGVIFIGDTVANANAVATQPTGAVLVNSDFTTQAATNDVASAITVDGGTTITVNQTVGATAAALTNTTGSTTTQGAVTITGGSTTTDVTVTQAKAVTVNPAVVGVDAVSQTKVLTFSAMTAGQTTIVDGLTFTAAKALTAAEAAAAFADLTASDDQSSGGPSANGAYTGSTSANWTSGAVSGATVTFTEVTAGASPALVVNTGTVVPTVVTSAAGTAATAAEAGLIGIVNGAVNIADAGTDSITTVTVDGYGNSTVASDALATLNLANGVGTMAVTTAATALAFSVNDVAGAVDLDAGGASITDLALTASTEDSSFALTAAAVTALTVSGDADVSLTADLAALETVVVSGTAGLTLAAASADTITSVNTSATTGTVTTNLNAGIATYTGGSGVDVVTTQTTTTPTKAVSLGAGDDTLVLAAGTQASTSILDGGDGTDILSMAIADIDAVDAAATFDAKVINFEQLVINNAIGDDDGVLDTVTVDLANLTYNHVTTSGAVLDTTIAANTDILLLDNMAANGTVVLTVDGVNAKTTVVLDDATGSADSLNVILSSAAAISTGTLTAAGVETIAITATDTNTTAHSDTLTLVATASTAVTVSGNASLTLVNTGNVAQATIDASAMTGNLTVTAAGTTATIITGGAGDDVLVASTAGDTLIGGAGDDTLTGSTLSKLTGGEGSDTFVMGSTGSTAYATITDAATGDVIQVAGTGGNFQSTEITLLNATFSDFVNEAINTTVAGDISWFQFGTDTFIVDNADGGANDYSAADGDMIIAITGLVDMSTASFNATANTIEFA